MVVLLIYIFGSFSSLSAAQRNTENEDSAKPKRKKNTNIVRITMHECAQVGDMAMRGYNNLDISCFITTEWQFRTSRFWWWAIWFSYVRSVVRLARLFFLIFALFNLSKRFSHPSVSHSLQRAIMSMPMLLISPRAQLQAPLSLSISINLNFGVHFFCQSSSSLSSGYVIFKLTYCSWSSLIFKTILEMTSTFSA